MESLKSIIQNAIESEVESYEFYAAAAKKMQDASAKALFNELAEEELKHREILLNLDLSKMQPIPTDKLPDFGISEDVEKPVLSVEMKYVDAIALAMKNEEEAMTIYANLAKCSDNPEQQRLFEKLASMEKGHKARLEEIYNNAAFAEVW